VLEPFIITTLPGRISACAGPIIESFHGAWTEVASLEWITPGLHRLTLPTPYPTYLPYPTSRPTLPYQPTYPTLPDDVPYPIQPRPYPTSRWIQSRPTCVSQSLPDRVVRLGCLSEPNGRAQPNGGRSEKIKKDAD